MAQGAALPDPKKKKVELKILSALLSFLSYFVPDLLILLCSLLRGAALPDETRAGNTQL